MHEETDQPDVKNRGGKPLTIGNDTLFSNRDCWIGLLSNWWVDIGWPLSRVRTADDVRAILASMPPPAAPEQVLLAPFVRQTSAAPSAKAIQQSRNELKTLNEREYALTYEGHDTRQHRLTEHMRESKVALREAWSAADPSREVIRAEHVERVVVLSRWRRDIESVRRERPILLQILADQEAAFAQHELCAFIRRQKYVYSPLTLARAMAGLPYIGAAQSHRRVPRNSRMWPSFQFRVFEIVEKAWKGRTNHSKAALLKRIEKRVRSIPTTRPDGSDDHHAIHARQYFVENWSYLVGVVDRIVLTDSPAGAIPYVLVKQLHERVSEASSAERVIAAKQQLVEDATQNHRRRRTGRLIK
jgi:hypothetical protein